MMNSVGFKTSYQSNDKYYNSQDDNIDKNEVKQCSDSLVQAIINGTIKAITPLIPQFESLTVVSQASDNKWRVKVPGGSDNDSWTLQNQSIYQNLQPGDNVIALKLKNNASNSFIVGVHNSNKKIQEASTNQTILKTIGASSNNNQEILLLDQKVSSLETKVNSLDNQLKAIVTQLNSLLDVVTKMNTSLAMVNSNTVDSGNGSKNTVNTNCIENEEALKNISF